MPTPERTRELLTKSGAIIEDHFVGTNDKHFSVYVAKDRAARLTSVVSELCEGIAERFAGNDIDAVIAPAVGGISLSQWTAHHITRLRPDRPEVLALYSEHEEMVLRERKIGGKPFSIRVSTDEVVHIGEGQKLLLRLSSFALKRGFDGDVRGKRVLEVEDILTTGGSAARTAQAIVRAGGILVGLGVLVNGAGIKAADIGVDRLEALMNFERKLFSEEECARTGLCAKGIPVNTEFGHGAEFLARRQG